MQAVILISWDSSDVIMGYDGVSHNVFRGAL